MNAFLKKMIFSIIVVSAGLGLALGFSHLNQKVESDFIETVGIVEATEVNLSAKISERIIQLSYRVGDTVPADAVAIALDRQEVQAEVAQAEASVSRGKAARLAALANQEKAKASLRDAKRSFDRIFQLAGEGLASQADLDKVTTQLDLAHAEIKATEAQVVSADAEIKELEANLAVSEVRLLNTMVRAPIRGVVTLKAHEVGEMVAPGQTILTLVDIDHLWVRIDLDETLVSKVRMRTPAEIRIDALPDRFFSGEVVEIGPEGEFATQRDVTRGRQDIKTFRVKIRVTKSDGLLKPGMTTSVRLQTPVSTKGGGL